MLSKHKNFMIVIGIWVYAFMMVLPTICGFHGEFGYNEDLGKCDYIETETDDDPRLFFYSIGFGLPLILIVVSYYSIWRNATKLSSFLKPHL